MKIGKFILLALMLFATSLLTVKPAYAYGYYEKTIDILVVEDEEFASLWFYPKNVWYNNFFHAREYFTVCGMPMEVRGIISWDSDDNCHDLYYLLQEAIRETGYTRLMYYNGYYIDLLVVFTGQDDPNMAGFSPPDWYALIIKYTTIFQYPIMEHELGHQFNLEHCNNECFMNPSTIGLYGGLCSMHLQQAKDNYPSRFWRWVEVPIYRRGGGGGHCFLM